MAANEWYLRTPDETYGPVTKAQLVEWARMGRIQPGQELSEDRTSWMPVTQLPFLDMRWGIDIGDGTPRGPFNKEAAQALLASGRLPGTSRLVEMVPEPDGEPDEPAAVASVPEDETPPAADGGGPAPDDAPPAAAADPEQVAELKRQIETLQAGMKAAVSRAAEAEARIQSARNEAEAFRQAADRAEARVVAVQAEVEAAKANEAAAKDAALRTAEQLAERDRVLNEKMAALAEKASALAEREAALATRDSALAEKDSALAEKDSALAEKDSALAEKTTALEAAQKEAAAAAAKAAAAESDLAELFSTSQANEEAYQNRIQSLSNEIRRLPPTAQLAADVQTAVYAMMKEEADELAAEMQAEARELEELKQLRLKRGERLVARRQQILRVIGTDAEDMTRRAMKAHPEDPRTVHLRQELDALRVLQERSARESEQRIRDLSAKVRERESELVRLRQQVSDITVIYRQLQETREKLRIRERELVEERQKSEAERQQSEAAQQALMTRLSALEMGLPGATHQSREARSVRLAPWMGLKR
ncbi:MAG: hypothetical protein ACI4Q3_02705 [Kiritimatiellia bacterium]